MKSALLFAVTAISSSLASVLSIPTTQNKVNLYSKRASEWICGVVSPSTLKYAIGVGSSEAQALNVAKMDCGSDCTNTDCVMNGCVAITQGSIHNTVAIASGWGSMESDLEHAESQAMTDCSAGDPSCQLSDNGCTGNAT